MATVITEGKTKIVREHPTRPDCVLLQSKDAITAGDGARKDSLPGKARLATRTTCNVFRYLEVAGVESAFVGPVDEVTFAARRIEMIPLEVVIRRLATGSYLKRRKDVVEGFRFDPPMVEFFMKDDARHDPLLTREEIVKYQLLNSVELELVVNEARRCFVALEMAWDRQQVTLVDLKVEFGRQRKRLILADVIDNDSWRIWPEGDKSRMRDKQVYRNLSEVTPEALQKVLENYEWVANATGQFLTAAGSIPTR